MEAADAVCEGCARVAGVCDGRAREIVSIPRPVLQLILALLEEEARGGSRFLENMFDDTENDEWLYVKTEGWE